PHQGRSGQDDDKHLPWPRTQCAQVTRHLARPRPAEVSNRDPASVRLHLPREWDCALSGAAGDGCGGAKLRKLIRPLGRRRGADRRALAVIALNPRPRAALAAASRDAKSGAVSPGCSTDKLGEYRPEVLLVEDNEMVQTLSA